MPSSKLRDEDGTRIQKFAQYKEGKEYTVISTDEAAAILDLIQIAPSKPRKYQSYQEVEKAVQGYWDWFRKKVEGGAKLYPDMEGLCSYMGICRKTLLRYITDNRYGEGPLLEMALNNIAMYKKQMALNGKIPPIIFATDFNNNHGYTQAPQKIEVYAETREKNKEELIAAAESLPD